MDSELADINQAIALSLALDAELRRMKLEQQHPGSTAAPLPQDPVRMFKGGESCVHSEIDQRKAQHLDIHVNWCYVLTRGGLPG